MHIYWQPVAVKTCRRAPAPSRRPFCGLAGSGFHVSFSSPEQQRGSAWLTGSSCLNPLPSSNPCRCSCGQQLANTADLVNVPAPDAEVVIHSAPLTAGRNATVSRLRNPSGVAFDLVTVAEAPGGVGAAHAPTAEATWFPGFEWQVLLCSSCGRHVGWRFTPQAGPIAAVARAVYSEQERPLASFVGLVLENLRFDRRGLMFRWSPKDETLLAASAELPVEDPRQAHEEL